MASRRTVGAVDPDPGRSCMGRPSAARPRGLVGLVGVRYPDKSAPGPHGLQQRSGHRPGSGGIVVVGSISQHTAAVLAAGGRDAAGWPGCGQSTGAGTVGRRSIQRATALAAHQRGPHRRAGVTANRGKAALQADLERLTPVGASIFATGWGWVVPTRRPRQPTAFDIVLDGLGASGAEAQRHRRRCCASLRQQSSCRWNNGGRRRPAHEGAASWTLPRCAPA